jgi:hypothetical protein
VVSVSLTELACGRLRAAGGDQKSAGAPPACRRSLLFYANWERCLTACGIRCGACAPEVGASPDDVYGSRSEGCLAPPEIILQGHRDCHATRENWRAGVLAATGAVAEGLIIRAQPRRRDALRKLWRTTLDGKRLPRVVVRILTMTQAPGALRIPTVFDYERTLILAIELSNTSWVLAAQIPACQVSKPSVALSRLPKR